MPSFIHLKTVYVRVRVILTKGFKVPGLFTGSLILGKVRCYKYILITYKFDMSIIGLLKVLSSKDT